MDELQSGLTLSGSGRLRAFFSFSGIDRSDKLQVFKSPWNGFSFGTFAFRILKQVGVIRISSEFRKPEKGIVNFHAILHANLFQQVEAFW